MYEIKRAQSLDFDKIKTFLCGVPDIKEFDEDVLKNASILYKNGEIFGVVSFEQFFNYALIRYFVFKRSVEDMVIKELFDSIVENIAEHKIEYIFSLVNNRDIYELFSSLEFVEANKEDVFLEEISVENSKLKDTKLMLRTIKIN